MLRMKSASGKGLLQCAPADHGGNIYKIAEETGLSVDKLIDFSASINPLGISRRVKAVITKELDSLVNYPDPDTTGLRQKLAQYNDIDPETIICGNGSTELIYLIPRALQPGRALIPAPTFSEYERAIKISQGSGSRVQGPGNGIRIEYLHLQAEDGFRIVPDEFISAMRECLNSSLVTRHLSLPSAIVFLCNPNNPTGELLGRNDVLEIAEAAKKMKCVLVVDEAFMDFCPEQSVLKDVQDNPYLIVLRSMTKFYALTGLRIGYAVFHESRMQTMRHFKEPWTVNNLAQQAAITALDDIDYAERTFALIKKEKEFLERGFRKLGLELYPSAVNYYLLNVGERSVVPLLREKGILVRDCANFKGLDGSYIRVAVKSRRHNKMLLKGLRNIYMAPSPLPPPVEGGGSLSSLAPRGRGLGRGGF